MTLAEEYKRQFGWRSWSEAMNLLPSLQGKTVLDLGCGVGDQAVELAARGANVIGVDANNELLEAARARRASNVEFRGGDISELHNLPIADVIWCSFAAAYAPEFGRTLAGWRQYLKPSGWIVITEVNNLFGHEPVESETRAQLAAYAEAALAANRYDFHMGRKLIACLQAAGFTVLESRILADSELSFDGPAAPDVLKAWRARLNRLSSLQVFCGSNFSIVRDDLLDALSRDDHRSDTKVYCCVGRL